MKKLYTFLGVLVVTAVAYAATTYTINYNLAKPGDQDRNYGSLIRKNFDTIDTQMKINEDSISTHITDATASHAASSILATPGANLCTTQTNVQDFLTCLDGVLDPSVSGIVLVTGDQSIAGIKTFINAPVFSAVPNGILSTDATGLVSASTVTGLLPLTTKGDILGFDTESVRVPVGTDGQHLVADSAEATGIKWVDTNPKWRKFTYAFSDLSSASNSFGVTMFSLTAGEGIDTVIIKHNTAFAGVGLTLYRVEVGVTGDLTRYASPFEVTAAVLPTYSSINNVVDVPNFGATESVILTAISAGVTLDQATAGSVDVYVRTFKLP